MTEERAKGILNAIDDDRFLIKRSIRTGFSQFHYVIFVFVSYVKKDVLLSSCICTLWEPCLTSMIIISILQTPRMFSSSLSIMCPLEINRTLKYLCNSLFHLTNITMI
ncbi:hypothetical protein RIR_jg36796.t1 [Rhizophagus irregularis DAOM 181602=DAOM 197198]|nr:hypothetical protein RIR_jg36796.t1 [Rhizophagus irregularis DAOM 181602=DAOM 197198]